MPTGMNQSFEYRQSMDQEMRLNQFQQQSLRFLQSSVAELRDEIEELCKKLPELQWKEGELEAWEQGTVKLERRQRYPGEWRLENQWHNGRFLSKEELSQSSDAKQQMLENYAGENESPDLRETLREQIFLWKLKAEEKEFCELVLQNLDEQGFNCENPILIATTLMPHSLAQKRRLLHLLRELQQLEPLGSACDSPLHSLRVQAQLRYPNSHLAKVLEALPSLEILGSREAFLDYLYRKGYSKDQADTLLQDLQKLEPYPARGYQLSKSSQSFRIYPEIEVYLKENSELEISLLNNLGAKLEIRVEGREEKAQLKARSQEAEIILQQLQRREETLLRIAESVFAQQQNFVRNGIMDMQILSLQGVADNIGLHVSTVSRCIQSKYCKTPWGTYPLRFFFSQGVKSGQAREQVKERIVEILREFALSTPIVEETAEQETVKHKISDMKLSQRLEKLGVQVARRTVAKYRAELLNEGRL